jgi:tetratricopeptide (TPR) repeat protein
MSRSSGSFPTALMLVLFAWGAAFPLRAQPADDSSGVAPAQAGEALATATEAVATACRTDAALHGAWVRLEPDVEASNAAEIKFRAHVLVDADHAAEQLPQVQKLLDGLRLSHRPRMVEPVRHAPLSRLVPLLQAAAERASGKRGCYVRGAYYAVQHDETGNEIFVVKPFGRLENERQLDAVLDCFARQVDRAEWDDYRAYSGASLRPVVDQLAIRGASPRLIQAYRDLDDALANDVVLKGVRIELAECLDHMGQFTHYDVYQYVTQGRAEAQRAKLAALLPQRLGDHCQVMADEVVPLERLIHRLNLAVEGRTTLNGCWVDGAYFGGAYSELPAAAEAPAGGNVQRQSKLVLYGQITSQQDGHQREWIAELAGALVQLDPEWRDYAGEFAVVADGMTAMAPSLGRGQALYGHGLAMFRSGRFEEAWRAFHYASLEAPDSLPYRYWRILAELQLGRREEALDHMIALVGRDITATKQLQVARSLHRIQGPLRMELLRLEARARFEYYDRRHDLLLGSLGTN